MTKQHQLEMIDTQIDHLIDRISAAIKFKSDGEGRFFQSEYEQANYIATLHHQIEVLKAKQTGLQGNYHEEDQRNLIRELMKEIDLITEVIGTKAEAKTMVSYIKLISLFKKYGFEVEDELPF